MFPSGSGYLKVESFDNIWNMGVSNALAADSVAAIVNANASEPPIFE